MMVGMTMIRVTCDTKNWEHDNDADVAQEIQNIRDTLSKAMCITQAGEIPFTMDGTWFNLYFNVPKERVDAVCTMIDGWTELQAEIMGEVVREKTITHER